MRPSSRSTSRTGTRLVLALMTATMLVPPPAQAAMMMVAAPEGPAAPVQPGAPRSSAEDRALRYFDLSIEDAMYIALVEGDFEFAVATLGGLATATSSRELLGFVTGVQALKRDDFNAAAAAFARTESTDMVGAALGMVTQLQIGNEAAGLARWELFGEETGGEPFYRPWRGWLAERANDKAAALELWREADDNRELLFSPMIAKRYFVLLAEADGARAALERMDDLFGPVEIMDTEMRELRAAIEARRARLPELSIRQAGAEMLRSFVTLMQLARMAPQEQRRGRRTAPRPDADAIFINDALYLRTALVLEPNNPKLRSEMAGLLSDYGEDRAALAVMEAPGAPPPSAETLMQLSGHASAMHRIAAAVAYLERVPVAERSISWHQRRAWLALAQRQWPAAIEQAGTALRLAEQSGDERVLAAARWQTAGIFFQTGDAETGTKMLDDALAAVEANDILRAYLALSLAHYVPERRAEGIRILRRSLGGFGVDHNLLASFGYILTESEATLDEGIGLLREALSMRPRSPDMLNNLGYALVDKEYDIEEGFLLLQTAHERNPDSASITDSLGWAYYKLGHLEDALRLLELAVSQTAEDPSAEVIDHLGDVLWHLGRRDEAQARWREASQLDMSYDGLPTVREKLANGLTTPPPPRRPLPVADDPDAI